MAICELHLSQSNVLEKMVSLTVLVPEGRPGPFPVLYLLHGLSDDHTAWTRRTALERYVGDLPLIVVMPNGERGFYTDAKDRPKAAYETNLVRDIVGFVDRTFQTVPAREGRMTAGLSMGGYGAVKLALKYPDLFCAGVSHSGAVGIARRGFGDDERGREWRPVFGPASAGGPDDLFALAEHSARASLPALRIDCGVDDFLIEDNRAFHSHLAALGIPHEYAEHAGGHDWEYWELHIQDTLAFAARVLNLERAA